MKRNEIRIARKLSDKIKDLKAKLFERGENPRHPKKIKQSQERKRKMARLSGVDLPRNKRMEVALTYIYGIGPTRAKNILAKTGISPDLRTDNLTEEDIKVLREELSNYHIEGDLRRDVAMNIKRLQEIGSYRGLRHKRKLPCRGQRTKTNARTRRGKKTAIAGKKK
jgi:small subunit ribosomal protein S13